MKEKLFKLYKFSNSWTGTVIIVLFIIFFVAQAFIIPSGSMKNTLLIGDQLFVKKFAYGTPTPTIPWVEIPVIPGTDGHIIDGDKPQRGDIVIFRYPKDIKTYYVKRAIATPGDRFFFERKVLYLRPKEGNAFIETNYHPDDIVSFGDELWVKSPYKREHPKIQVDNEVMNNGLNPPQIFNYYRFQATPVPEGEYFMVGDNRDHSNDSRFWGTVPYGLVVGKPWFIYFSMDENYQIRWERMFKPVEDLEGL